MSSGRVVILLGPPGSGKGTQAARLSEELGLPHVATGDLFRENLSNDTPIGRKAKSFMESGQLVPDEIVIEMLFDRVSRPDCRAGFVLDGFPRTVPQAESFEHRARDRWSITVFLLSVEDEVLIERAAGRLVCRECGNVHHRSHSPPAIAGRCDRCGGELYRRDDDAPHVARERLRVYRDQTAVLVSSYRERGMLEDVDGTRPPDAVYADLWRLVGKGA